MSFILFCEKLHGKLTGLQRRWESGESLTPINVLIKLTLFGLKLALTLKRAKPYKQDCLNIVITFTGGIGDLCIQFQWAKTFVEELKKRDCKCAVVLLSDKKDFLQKISQGLDLFEAIVTYDELGQPFKADLLLNLNLSVTPILNNEHILQKYAPFLVENIKKCFTSQKFLRGNGRFPTIIDKSSEHFLMTHYALLKGYDRRDLLGSSGLCQFDRNTPCYFPIDHEKVLTTLDHFKLAGCKFILICSSVGSMPMSDDISKELSESYIKRAARLIPPELAAGFIKMIKKELPEYLVVQMGPKDSVEFAGCDLNLIGLTTYDESIDLLYAADCYIGMDSGNTHLRHAMGKRSVVLWGPTSADFVGYDTDFNIQGICKTCARVPCNGCMWVAPDWDLICSAGLEHPECMNGIKPEQVLTGVIDVLMDEEGMQRI